MDCQLFRDNSVFLTLPLLPSLMHGCCRRCNYVIMLCNKAS